MCICDARIASFQFLLASKCITSEASPYLGFVLRNTIFNPFHFKSKWKIKTLILFFFFLTEQEALQSFGLETLECFVLVGNHEMKLSVFANHVKLFHQTISFWVDLNLCYPQIATTLCGSYSPSMKDYTYGC